MSWPSGLVANHEEGSRYTVARSANVDVINIEPRKLLFRRCDDYGSATMPVTNHTASRPAAPADADPPSPAQRMGGMIRGLGRRYKLTLVQLAERTELSHSFLSQVERGLAQPSMRSLHRIAQVLGTSQDKLIAGAVTDDETSPIALLRAGQGVKIPLGGAATPTGSARQLLTEPGGFYPTEFVGIGRAFGEFFQHEGNEFLY